jgi:hypothetical protein
VRNEFFIDEAFRGLAEKLDVLVQPGRDVGVGSLLRSGH